MIAKLKSFFRFLKSIIGTLSMIFIGTFLGLGFIISFVGGTSTSNSKITADGFTINSYKIILDVKENNQVNVTENITVDWYDTNHHGIYKFIPEWLEYTDKFNNTQKRKSSIKNLSSSSDYYSVTTINNKKRIRLGDNSSFVKPGLKTYSISYLYDMGKDPYKGFDEFTFHAFGDYWGTVIKNASIEIKMPKDISSSEINFFTDKYRKNNINNLVDYKVINNTIYATVFDKLPLSTSLTIDIALPDKYFNGGSYNYGIFSFVLIIFIFYLTYLTIKLWQKYGKDFPKYSQTIEFYPPDNLNAAEVGYIFNEEYNKKQSVALIIELASKGYIQINSQDQEIEIINLYPIPRVEVKEPIIHAIKIKKLKNIDNTLSKEGYSMMQYLFKEIPFIKNDVVEITDSIDDFLKVKDELIANGFIEVLNDNINDIKNQEEETLVQEKKCEIKNIERQKQIAKLEPLNQMEEIIYNGLFENEDNVILSKHLTLYKAFNTVKSKLITENISKINDKEATVKLFESVGISIISFILFYLSYYVFEDLDPKWQILYLLALISCFITVFFTIFMERKTEYGQQIKSKIAGFRDFLIKVEKNQLEDLVLKNPKYFYEILPYTYVLGISKKWISKFENIPMPKKDMGTFNYSSDSAFSSLARDVNFHSSSSSSSSSGGGCSSCGGGCSSCGGGGSW